MKCSLFHVSIMHLCIFYELYQVCFFRSFMVVTDVLTNGCMFLFDSYPDIHLYNVFCVLVVWAVAQVQSFSHRRRSPIPLDHRYPFPTDSPPLPNSCFVFLRCGYQSSSSCLDPRATATSLFPNVHLSFFLLFFLVYPTRHAPPTTSHPRFCPLCSSILSPVTPSPSTLLNLLPRSVSGQPHAFPFFLFLSSSIQPLCFVVYIVFVSIRRILVLSSIVNRRICLSKKSL